MAALIDSGLPPETPDYMFFRLDSFIFAPLGAALPDWATVLITYAGFLLIHALPHLPSWLKNRTKQEQKA